MPSLQSLSLDLMRLTPPLTCVLCCAVLCLCGLQGIPTGSNGPWATTAFGRQPTFLGANTADKGFVCTGVVYQVTPEQYKLQVWQLWPFD